MLRRYAVAACVALCVGAAGCGGGGDAAKSHSTATSRSAPKPAPDVNRYRSQVAKVTGRFARAGQQLRAAVGNTPQQAASALSAFQGSVRAAADGLSRLHPPAGVAAAQRDLAAAFRAIAAACQPSVDAGRAGDTTRFAAARRTLQAQLNGALGARARAAATRIDAGLAAG